MFKLFNTCRDRFVFCFSVDGFSKFILSCDTYNIFFDGEGRADVSAKEKEREDKVRKIREQQEDDRKRKLEELKQHVRSPETSQLFNFDNLFLQALQAQKFREVQENERRRHIDELRSKDMDRRQQVGNEEEEIENKLVICHNNLIEAVMKVI